VVNFDHSKLLFNDKYEAMELVRLLAGSIGKHTDYSTPNKDGSSIIKVDLTDEVLGVTSWVCTIISSDEADAEETENAQILALQKKVKQLESDCHTKSWKLTEAEKKAEKQELNACRLAEILEANGLDTEGKKKEEE
jgi:hypothetical protein